MGLAQSHSLDNNWLQGLFKKHFLLQYIGVSSTPIYSFLDV